MSKAASKSAAKSAAKGPAEPSKAARQAQAEAAVPIEPIGPGTEHEDHEGGITDSLAKRGVRGVLATPEELEEQRQEEIKEGLIRAPSVRERQTGMAASLAQGGAVVQREETDAKGEVVAQPRGAHAVLAAREGARIIPVVATRTGQYPADGRLRVAGEAFDYAMGKDEKKLPSWMKDPTGALESRTAGEAAATPAPILVEIAQDGKSATLRSPERVKGDRSVL